MEDTTASFEIIEKLLHASDDVFWAFSQDWETLVFVNDAYEEVYGRSTAELHEDPQDFLLAVHPDDREQVETAMTRLSGGDPVELEFRVDERAEYGRWVWVRGQPLTDDAGTITHVAGFSRDITQRKASRQELQRQNERLDEFTSVVSHDLRNPLNVAQGNVQLAQRACDATELATAADALDRMESLIDELLTLARQGEHVEDPEPVELGAVAEACWQTVTTAGADLAVDGDRTVEADRTRFRELIENLLRNAVEHGGEDVRVTVGTLADGFYIEDDGPGIPPEDRDTVFESGYTTAEQGSGFGLNIVRQIAEAHGWRCDLTEGTDGGARFEFTEKLDTTVSRS